MPDIRRGLIIVNTGPGKGKTTAAMGTGLRAVGQGMKVVMLQFLKHEAEELKNAADKEGKRLSPKEARQAALQQMCRVVFNLNEFVYTD